MSFNQQITEKDRQRRREWMEQVADGRVLRERAAIGCDNEVFVIVRAESEFLRRAGTTVHAMLLNEFLKEHRKNEEREKTSKSRSEFPL